MTPSTSPISSNAIIINDGGLPGLLAAWSEGSARSSDRPTDQPKGVAFFPPVLSGHSARRLNAVQRQVGVCGLSGWTDRAVFRSESRAGQVADAKEAFGVPRLLEGAVLTAMLMSACVEAARRGLSRVVWPVHAGASSDIDLSSLADICDRALLISQLATMDLPRVNSAASVASKAGEGGVIRIETPYADFTDAEIMELALDMDVPIGACVLCEQDGEAACGACNECQRWRAALTQADPQGLLEPGTLWGQAKVPTAV